MFKKVFLNIHLKLQNLKWFKSDNMILDRYNNQKNCYSVFCGTKNKKEVDYC